MSLRECHSSHCNFVCPGLSLVWSSLFSPSTYSTWLLSLGVGFKVYFLQLEMITFGGMATWIFWGTKLSFSIWTLFGLSWHLSFRSKIDPFFNQKHPSIWGKSLPGIIYVVRRSKKDVFARTEWCHGDLVFFLFYNIRFLEDSKNVALSCFIFDSFDEDSDLPSLSWGFCCCGEMLFLIQLYLDLWKYTRILLSVPHPPHP